MKEASVQFLMSQFRKTTPLLVHKPTTLHLSTTQLLCNLLHPLLILLELGRGSHGILDDTAHGIRHGLVSRFVGRLVDHVLDTVGRPEVPHAGSPSSRRLEISV